MNEAMASGRPVIASNKCGGAIDLLMEGKTGWTFKAGDEHDLLEKMERALNADLYKMGSQGREHVQQFNYLDFLKAIPKITD